MIQKKKRHNRIYVIVKKIQVNRLVRYYYTHKYLKNKTKNQSKHYRYRQHLYALLNYINDSLTKGKKKIANR